MITNNRRNFLKKIGLSGLSLSVLPQTLLAKEIQTETISEDESNQPSNHMVVTNVSIFQTTDVHCQIHAHDELFWEKNEMVFRKTGGYAHLSSYFNQLRKQYPNTFFMDTGDMFQGSELSVKTSGEAFVPILNALNYDLYLPGNWEVIYGKKSMQKLMGSLHSPKICANMFHDKGNGQRGELIFQPYHIWFINGIKIGFIGYTDHLVPIRQSPNYSKGILYSLPEENLAHYVEVLREQEHCAFVGIIAHLGLSQQIALSNLDACKGVDYIFGGDTHERVRKPIQGKYAKVVEPGAFGSFIGHLKLKFENGKYVSDEYELLEVDAEKLKPDPKMAQILSSREQTFTDSIEKIVGYSTIPLYRYFVVENTIDTMILNALNWSFPEIDIVLSNGFRFCPPRATADKTGNIPVTNGYIYDMLPVDSNVRFGKVTGEQIFNWLEKELNNVFAKNAAKRFGGWVIKFKGMKVEFLAYGEEGKRVQKVTIRNQELDKSKVYSILACERDGDPDDMLCRMKNVKETTNSGKTLHEVMRQYLEIHSPVTPTPERNAIPLDAPSTLLTQVSGVDYEFR
jgi:S-sulfosulfanyl-L-cysteine sulfohydrolase